MKHKLTKLVSILVVLAFLQQGVLQATPDFCCLRPVSLDERKVATENAKAFLGQLREEPLLAGVLFNQIKSEVERITGIFREVYNAKNTRQNPTMVSKALFEKVSQRTARHIVKMLPGYKADEQLLRALADLLIADMSVCRKNLRLTEKQIYITVLKLSPEQIRGLIKKYPRLILNRAFETNHPMTTAKAYSDSYATVLKHMLSKGEEVSNARSFASKAFYASEPIAKAEQHLAAYKDIVKYVEQEGQPEIARTIASQSYARSKPMEKAKSMLHAYNDLLLYLNQEREGEPPEERQMRSDVAGVIASAAFTASEGMARELADKYWANYLWIYREIKSKGGSEIARLIASHAFHTKNYKRSAKKYYENYEKVIVKLESMGHGDIAGFVAGIVFTSAKPITDAVIKCRAYNEVIEHLLAKGFENSKRLAEYAIRSPFPLKEADILADRYHAIKQHLETRKPGEPEDIWQRRKEIATSLAIAAVVTKKGYLELADTYFARYEEIRTYVENLGYPGIARWIATLCFISPDYKAMAIRKLKECVPEQQLVAQIKKLLEAQI
ncbi:MAG: hypothetical protein NTV07_06250 [Candidatus Omnitrophica bacterium]|nr:hypothetical protein [Candidatus Omnitrophota bacterium]